MKKVEKYHWKQITGKIGLFETIRQHGMMRDGFGIVFNKNNVLWEYEPISELREHVPDKRLRGGCVIFPYIMNSGDDDDLFFKKLKGFLNNWYKTVFNRLTLSSRLMRIVKTNHIEALSIGNFMKGRYFSDTGEIYNGRALCIDIVGINNNTLIELVESLCDEFYPKSVLFKKYFDGDTYFVYRN